MTCHVAALDVPGSNENVSDSTTALLIGCFGAQAILSGLFAAFSRFTRTTFLVYAIALLPFFVFNYYFVFVVPMFSRWMALDFASNLAMLALSIAGWRRSPSEPHAQAASPTR